MNVTVDRPSNTVILELWRTKMPLTRHQARELAYQLFAAAESLEADPGAWR